MVVIIGTGVRLEDMMVAGMGKGQQEWGKIVIMVAA